MHTWIMKLHKTQRKVIIIKVRLVVTYRGGRLLSFAGTDGQSFLASSSVLFPDLVVLTRLFPWNNSLSHICSVSFL